jgi:Uma2 family endonuclease
MATTDSLMTAEELLNAPDMGRCELLRGELRMMSPSGSLHGRITAYVAGLLWDYVKEHPTGEVFGAETGFIMACNPDTVRAPDVAFVTNARLPDPLPPGFFPGPPDLAVEVLSPGDRASEVTAKTRDWLAAGCQEVWNVDPQTQTITVHRADGIISLLNSSDMLESAVLLPGFQLVIKELF